MKIFFTLEPWHFFCILLLLQMLPAVEIKLSKIQFLTGTIGALGVLVAAGCLEWDSKTGPNVSSEAKQQINCAEGMIAREAVSPQIARAFPLCCDSGLPNCCKGERLIPSFLIPENFRDRLAQAPGHDDAVCVPEVFLLNPQHTPKRCTSLFGYQGACLSRCLPEVSEARAALPQSECNAGEVCAPCVDPETNEVTGACEMGEMACEPPPDPPPVCKDYLANMDLSSYPTCCSGGRAHCAPKSLVVDNTVNNAATGASLDTLLELERCDSGGTEQGYCIPDDFLARGGQYTPKVCTALGRYEGRCISKCIPRVVADGTELDRDTCQADELCVPCYDPRTGEATGVCSVGPCDAPVQPPKMFEHCGAEGDDALCVPISLVCPEERAELHNFDSKGCGMGCKEPGTVCLPKKAIDAGCGAYKPKRCKPSVAFFGQLLSFINNPFNFDKMKHFKEGRCLSKCLPEVRKDADMLKQQSCDSYEVCVPCYDPRQASRGLVPTGACDR